MSEKKCRILPLALITPQVLQKNPRDAPPAPNLYCPFHSPFTPLSLQNHFRKRGRQGCLRSRTNTGRCTIYVQYLYNICTFTNCTSIVQLLYIYCTTTGVGTSHFPPFSIPILSRFCPFFCFFIISFPPISLFFSIFAVFY